LIDGRVPVRVVVALAAVLGLNSADRSTVGAVAPSLESSLGIGAARLGLLVAVSTAVAAIGTLPAGMLADRVNRVRLLTAAVAIWSVALACGGFAGSFSLLLASRLALGVTAALAGPTVASLVGDYVVPQHRGRIYGLILTGELLGSGLGFVASGNIAAVWSWREAMWVLAVIGLGLAWALPRLLTEPARSGRGAPIGFCAAMRRILAVPSNRSLILGSALGYFYFTGLRTFSVDYVHREFGVPEGLASTLVVLLGTGGIVGTLVAGRLGDRLVARGRRSARPGVAGAAYLLCAISFGTGLLIGGPLVAVAPLIFLGAAGLGGANPPLDAARLDLVEPQLWGRAEAIRTVLRSALEAPAPVLFGGLAARLSGTGTGSATGSGLADAFLILLVAPLAGGLLLVLRATRTYPHDVDQVRAREISS
jgi:predicted MFS family arabinose efflux permease